MRSSVYFIAILLATLVGGIQIQAATLYELYGEHVQYQNYHEVDFTNLPQEKISFSNDIYWDCHLSLDEYTGYEIDFDSWMRNQVTLSTDEIRALHPKALIDFVIQFLADHIVYPDPSIATSVNTYYPAEALMKGVGDCDKYSRALILIFDWMKKRNSSLNNVYVLTDFYGGERGTDHAWNAIAFLYHDKLVVTHVDPTFYDNGDSLESSVGDYVIRDPILFRASFYSAAGEFFGSLKTYKQFIDMHLALHEPIDELLYQTWPIFLGWTIMACNSYSELQASLAIFDELLGKTPRTSEYFGTIKDATKEAVARMARISAEQGLAEHFENALLLAMGRKMDIPEMESYVYDGYKYAINANKPKFEVIMKKYFPSVYQELGISQAK